MKKNIMEKFASKIKVGDKLNMYCHGWKIVKSVKKGFMTEVVFEDNTKHKYQNDESIFAV